MHSKKSNIGMAAKAFLLTAIGLPMGVSAQGGNRGKGRYDSCLSDTAP